MVYFIKDNIILFFIFKIKKLGSVHIYSYIFFKTCIMNYVLSNFVVIEDDKREIILVAEGV